MAAAPLTLPAARTERLGPDSPAFGRLSARQRALAGEALGEEPAFAVFRTRTRTDVGSWLGGSPVCALALRGELLLLAAVRNPLAGLAERAGVAEFFGLSNRPYVQRVPFADLQESTYNHVTGELLLAPAGGARVRRLRLDPVDGYQLLAQVLRPQEPPHA